MTVQLRQIVRSSLLGALAAALAAGPLGAQEHAHHGGTGGDGWRFGAHAVGLATRVTPAFAGESWTEGYLTQPVLLAHGRFLDGAAGFTGMLNLEGLTLEGGELSPGVWGEGYADRRHPHTYLHEAVGWATARAGGLEGSLAAGRGFAPFGTDDPMVRPFVKFPVNHHLAQILERAVGIAALRYGPVTLEAGLFNGDEPEGPADLPNLERFGDSWAARATLAPVRGVELQSSHARVASPEHALGGGYDQRKWSASARYERRDGEARRAYALVEWARTDDFDEDRPAGELTSWLAEGALRRRGVELAARYERTLRHEEERLADPFRTPYPHADAKNLGVTRWRSWTAAVSAGTRYAGVALRPFVEASLLRPTDTEQSAFSSRVFYGDDRIWSLSLGIRMGAGATHDRMGRYGAAVMN